MRPWIKRWLEIMDGKNVGLLKKNNPKAGE